MDHRLPGNFDSCRTVGGLVEIAVAFLRLGCISFGGPVAHLGYLREEFVRRRGWLSDDAYSDIVALCQFLPGATSSQVVFALGMRRAGLCGALLSSLCFLFPSAILMMLFASCVALAGNLDHAGWLHGLKLAAVAVVAQAVWGMGQKLCPDPQRLILALIAAATASLFQGSIGQVGVIVAGGLVGWSLYRKIHSADSQSARSSVGRLARHHLRAAASLIVFVMLLILLPTIAALSGSFQFHLFDVFYSAGSLVFGGGHVVLPLLRAGLVPHGWIGDSAFLAGYGAVQAMPGPLFTFAAYLGAVINHGSLGWLGGLWCLLAIFLPSWLLVGGALPFWDLIRTERWAQAALCGVNAAVVGILLAALYNPVWKQGVTNWRDVVVVIAAIGLLSMKRVPPWFVVILSAAIGQWVL